MRINERQLFETRLEFGGASFAFRPNEVRNFTIFLLSGNFYATFLKKWQKKKPNTKK